MSIKKGSNFFSEINIDTAKDFIDKYLKQIIYIIIIILAISFFIILKMNKLENSKKQLKIDYYKSITYINNKKDDEALKLLTSIYNSKYADENIKTIAGLRMANILNNSGKEDEAILIYKNIYEFSKNDDFLRNLSGLTALSIMINQNNSNEYSQIEEMINRLNNIDNPLLILVNEQRGMFEIQRGNKDNGIKILKDILKEDIDEDTKSRIDSVLSVYSKQ